MDSQSPGAIPVRPSDPVDVARLQSGVRHPQERAEPIIDPRIQPTAPAPSGTHVGYATTPKDPPFRPDYAPDQRKTRAQILEMRRAEREAGVDFWLANTGIMAKVRDLPFTDRIMLRGVPADMRKAIEQAVEISQSVDEGNISEALKLIDADAELSDGACFVGFVWPRLARSETERVAIMHTTGLADDDVLLLDDLHPDEKAAYRDFVFRDRDGTEEDVARVAQFQRADPGLEEAPDSEDRGSEAGGSLADAADGGERLLA